MHRFMNEQFREIVTHQIGKNEAVGLCCTYYCIWYRIRSVSGPEADTDCIHRIIQRIHCIAHVGPEGPPVRRSDLIRVF